MENNEVKSCTVSIKLPFIKVLHVIQSGAPKIAKLVQITHISQGLSRYIELVKGQMGP